MPSAMRSRGHPCEPTCACSLVSQGRSTKARTTCSRTPASRSGTPNFEVAVAVLIAPMEPLPTCGLTRSPSTDAVPAERRSPTRRSSSKLSAFTATPSESADRSSARVFAGESSTIFSGANPASTARRSSPGLATSQPMPHEASSRSTGTSEAAFAAKVCRTGTPGTPAKASRRAATACRTPSVSRKPATGCSSPSSPPATARRRAAANLSGRSAGRNAGDAADVVGVIRRESVMTAPQVIVARDKTGLSPCPYGRITRRCRGRRSDITRQTVRHHPSGARPE